jgi:phosphatidylserine/phosphatidylglycerophosphate/cardiolipin synthase-like enzyme
MNTIKIRRLILTCLCAVLSLALWAQSASVADSLMRDYFRQEGIAVRPGNAVTLLPSGQEKFDDLFARVRQARHHIHLEYFNFRNDSIANALFDLLAEKAAEGVEVRALFDAFGNSSNNQPLTRKHIKAIRARGIQLVKFDPFRFPYINHALHRDHRKIVVIDGQVGYTGGMNVAQYYIEGLPEIGPWRDMHARIEGPAVEDLQRIFATMWKKATKEEIEGEAYFPYSSVAPEGLHNENLSSSSRNLVGKTRWVFRQPDGSNPENESNGSNIETNPNGSNPEINPNGSELTSSRNLVGKTRWVFRQPHGSNPENTPIEEDIAIVDRRPHKTPKAIRRAYIAALDAAQQKVQLVNPYFVPSHSIMKALRRTLKRGVEVEIMIPAKSDIPFTPAAARYMAYRLHKRGAEVYVFNGGFHHSKIMMVDGAFCTVGSANLNSRSLRYDYEVNAFMMSAHTTGQLIQMYEADKQNSDVMDKAYYRSLPLSKRFCSWFAHLFTPFL